MSYPMGQFSMHELNLYAFLHTLTQSVTLRTQTLAKYPCGLVSTGKTNNVTNFCRFGSLNNRLRPQAVQEKSRLGFHLEKSKLWSK